MTDPIEKIRKSATTINTMKPAFARLEPEECVELLKRIPQWTKFNKDDRSTWPPSGAYVITPAAYGGYVEWRWFDWAEGPYFVYDSFDGPRSELVPALFDGYLWMKPMA